MWRTPGRWKERSSRRTSCASSIYARCSWQSSAPARAAEPASCPQLLAALNGPTLTESELEEAFLALCRRAGLQAPEVNAWMTLPDGSAIKVDFLWRNERLAVETDGHPFHRTRQSRERDTKRDQLLQLAGFEPVRFTGRQVAVEEEWVTRTLLALASRRDGGLSGRAGAQAA
jgi:very-short-patch-repair endonuclease